MANNFLTDEIIAKESLRLLINNLVAAPLVYRDYERYYNKKVGDTIQMKLPYRTKIAQGSMLQRQPMVDQTTNLVVDQHYNFGLEFSQKDRTLDISEFSSRYLNSGIVAIANQIDRSILLTLKNTAWSSGTPGTTPGTYLAFATAAAKQTAHAVPQDMRRAVVNPLTCANISNEVKGLFSEKMVNGTYPKGYKGDVAGYTFHETQNLPTHTVGAHGGTPLTNGATQTGSSIVTDGWTASTNVLKQGDVITFAGVYAVNPQNYENSGYLREFVVQADVTSDGSGNATISVYPAVNDGTLTTTNGNGETVSLSAYQNVTNAIADGSAITVKGTASATYRQDYLFHKEAIAMAMVDIEEPESAVIKRRVADKKTGTSMLLTAGYDINSGQQAYRIEALWGVKAIYPELAMRMWGASPES